MGTTPDAENSGTPYSRVDLGTRSIRIGVNEMKTNLNAKWFPTIVIGGGQAGLAVGYHLAKRGLAFQILDSSLHVGDAWRNRWDSLRLFNPARYAGLPGLRFPGRGDGFPTKDQMADYLVTYAQRFRLPVQNGVRVDRLWKEGDRFVLAAGEYRFECDNVVVAMANYQVPRVPAFAQGLDRSIVQMHASEYRNPSQLQPGGVLIVGVGNSGADIGIEVARTHSTWISGKESGHIPWRIESFFARFLLVRLFRFLGHHILTVKTPIGRKIRPKVLSSAAPLMRVKPRDLDGAGIVRVPRVTGVANGRPLLEDGRVLDVTNVIWCTGYHHGFPWIDLPVLGENGEPAHELGIVKKIPGLYFVGLHFLYSMTSATLMGVGRDAKRIAKAIASRTRASAVERRGDVHDRFSHRELDPRSVGVGN
jgi:putative flavoprotein involved in K+ transport